MGHPPPTGCVSARSYLQDAGAPDRQQVVTHLLECTPCQQWFERQPGALDGLFEDTNGLPALEVLSKANQRLDQPAASGPKACLPFPPIPKIPGYSIQNQVGCSSHSRVYLATQSGIHRPVAIKFVTNSRLAKNHSSIAREGSVLGGLRHPNILSIHQTGRWSHGIWLALEYCPKGSLKERIEQSPLPQPREAAALMATIASAVASAHSHGIIHGDIKPANILFSADDQPMLADFGLACQVTNLTLAPGFFARSGTLAYLAPGQVRGAPPTTRSDVHALGVILYQLLSGRHPFAGDTRFDMLLKIAHSIPYAIGQTGSTIPPDLAAICLKCLFKNPEERYSDAQALADDLNRFLAGNAVIARPRSAWEAGLHWFTHNRMAASALCLTGFILAGSLVLLSWLAVFAFSEKEKAEKSELITISLLAKAERQAYSSAVQAAHFQIEEGSYASATANLIRQPTERRGWEHHYLTSRLHQNQTTLLEHGGPVFGIAIRPDRKVFATASADCTIRLWDAEKAAPLACLLQGDHPFVNVTYSADGRHLAAADAEGRIHLYDSTVGTWSQRLDMDVDRNTSENNRRFAFALSADGSRVFFATRENRIGVWSVDRDAVEREFEAVHTKPIVRLLFTPGTNLIASADTANTVCLWDLESGGLVRRLPSPDKEVLCMAFSPDGRELIGGCKDKMAYVWSVETGKIRLKLAGHEDWINSVNMDCTGQRIASAGDDHAIRIWDATTGKLLNTLSGHTGAIHAVRFSADGRRIFSVAADKAIKVWNPWIRQGVISLPHNDWVRVTAFHPDGHMLATGTDDGQLRLWGVTTGALLMERQLDNKRLAGLQFSPDGSCLVVGGQRSHIDVLNVGDLSTIGQLRGHEGVRATPCLGLDGRTLYSISFDGKLGEWDLQGQRLKRLTSIHTQRPRSVAVSPDGQQVAVAAEQRIQILSSTDWRLLRELEGHSETVTDVTFNPDGTILASAGNDRKLLLWNLKTGKESAIQNAHESPISCVRFSPDGTRLLSTGFDRTLKLWDPLTKEEIITFNNHRGAVRHATFSPDGRWIASAGDDNQVLLWNGSERMAEYEAHPLDPNTISTNSRGGIPRSKTLGE